MAGSATAPATRCRNCLRRGSFMGLSQNTLNATRSCAAANGFQKSECSPAAGTNAAAEINGDSARPLAAYTKLPQSHVDAKGGNVGSWPILLKKSQTHEQRKSAQLRSLSTFDFCWPHNSI